MRRVDLALALHRSQWGVCYKVSAAERTMVKRDRERARPRVTASQVAESLVLCHKSKVTGSTKRSSDLQRPLMVLEGVVVERGVNVTGTPARHDRRRLGWSGVMILGEPHVAVAVVVPRL